jgi:hypothetical protein
MKHVLALLAAAGMALLAGSGCFYSVLQTPEVLPPGKVSLGPALTAGGMYDGGFGPGEVELSLITRVGVARNIEAGLRLSNVLGGMVDVKYQLLHKPFLMAADLGFSCIYMPAIDFMSHSDPQTVFALCPALLVGTERYYAGVKLMGSLTPTPYLMPGFVLGAAFGRRFKALPELNAYFAPARGSAPAGAVAGLAVGLQYTF